MTGSEPAGGLRKPAGFFEWRDALNQAQDLGLATRGVLSIIASYSTTKTGEDIRPSLSRIASRTGASRSTLSKHMATAVSLGWLEMTENRGADGRPNVYRLTIPLTVTAAGGDLGIR